jgi:formylglycine-generating enzyme required for sulfatase activity
MKHLLRILTAWSFGLSSVLLANNIAVSNVSTTGQNTNAGVNDANNYTAVKFNLNWENSWRHNSTSNGISYIAVKTGGTNYTGTPNVFIGSQGAVAWVLNTAVNAGDFLVVSATPNRYYRATTSHTTLGTAPTHSSGTTANLEFVSVTDAGGSGATATATVSSGEITGYTITAAGSGYTSLPSIHIFPTNGGSGATADVHIRSWWDAAWVFVKFRVGASNPSFSNVTLTDATNTVTLPSVTNLRVGMPVRITSGSTTLPAGETRITAINTSTKVVTLSNNATTTASNNALEFIRIWEHASLSATAVHHTAPAGSTMDVPSDGVGVFLYRSAPGTGTFNLSDVQLRWVYGTNGVRDDAVVQVQVFAIETVWVPQGSFAAGSGGGEVSAFTLTTINTATATTVPSGSGGFSASPQGCYPSGQTAPANASWPNGYDAFYCMKYEISQGQYRDFLNTLTRSQQENRVTMDGTLGRYAGGFTWNGSAFSGAVVSNLNTPANRNGLRLIIDPGGISPRTYACDLITSATLPTDVDQSNDGEWIAMSQLNWMDGCAYVDWAGLRPMTELEYEKACRGNQAPVATEYAWGSTSITGATGISNGGANNETFSNAGANCASNNSGGVQGPLRVGAFAGGVTTRAQAGATYYGIMEMSGNVWERAVTIGNADGRGFTGVQGNGSLSVNGHANQTSWPGLISSEVTGASGSGFRGGVFYTNNQAARVSDRTSGATTSTDRHSSRGFRGVRVFP